MGAIKITIKLIFLTIFIFLVLLYNDSNKIMDMLFEDIRICEEHLKQTDRINDKLTMQLNDISPTEIISTTTEYEYVYITEEPQECSCKEEENAYLDILAQRDYFKNEYAQIYKEKEQCLIRLLNE